MTSRLLVRRHAPDARGAVLRVAPADAGWNHVGFALVPLAAGASIDGGERVCETCVVLVSGRATLMADSVPLGPFGGRADPFADEAPGAAYVPAGMRFSLSAITPCEVALCSAPGKPGRAARIIAAADMPCEERGHGAMRRHVRNILPETEPADALLVVEVRTPGGHWSSYPPHKHDTAVEGEETALEEVYYHRLDPPGGFVVQRVYDDDRTLDETIAAGNGELVLVPRGYHPVGVPAGYRSYYLNAMAGPERKWRIRNDPVHEWLIAPSSQGGGNTRR